MRAPEIPQIWADPDRILTVEDMEDMPDDEFRYELDNGMLIVHPVPPLVHQLAVIRLAFLLHTALPAGTPDDHWSWHQHPQVSAPGA